MVLAAGYMAYPFATSVAELTLFRGIFAAGAAAIIATFTTVLTDYPQEQSRGKLVALGSMLNGLGLTILAGAGGQVIRLLTESGIDPVVAGRMAITGVGMLGFMSAVVVMLGLRGESLRIEHQRIPIAQLLREGIAAARNPRIAIAYVSALVSRGDNVVIGMYLSLWAQQAGKAIGLSPGDAQGKAGIMVAIVSASPLLVAPLFGILNDRLNRLNFLILALALSVFGYLGFGMLDSPIAGWAIPFGIVMGCGQVAAIIASQTLIGQEADPRIVGSTLGIFNLFGSVGTLLSGVLGGYLFDKWTNGGPFLMMGIASALLMLAAMFVRGREPS
jgi:MFS family permease